MAQIKVTASGFNLASSYQCVRTSQTSWAQDGSILNHNETFSQYTTTPNTASQHVTFEYSLPEHAAVNSAKVYATLGSPLNGAAVSKINGVSVGYDKTVSVDVTLGDGVASVSVPFVFQCNAKYHFHDHDDGTSYPDADYNTDNWVYIDLEKYPNSPVAKTLNRTYYASHKSSMSYSDIYLLIDYEEGSGGGETGGDENTGEDNDTPSAGGAANATSVVVEAEGFVLRSDYTCITEIDWEYTDDSHDEDTVRKHVYLATENSSTDTRNISFPISLPADAIIIRAAVHATLGSGMYGAKTLAINDVSVKYNSTVEVPVEIDPSASSVVVNFRYRCNEAAHNHEADGYGLGGDNHWDGNTFVEFIAFDHTSAVKVSDVYLDIVYAKPNAYWSLANNIVQPGETLDVSLLEYVEGNTYTAHAVFGDYASAETAIGIDAPARIGVPHDWLNAIPNSVIGTGAVVVREYNAGELVSETAKNFSLTCPDNAKPYFELAHTQRLLTVDGVTYPSLITDAYVQNKCGVQASWTGVAAQYGANIVSSHINVGGYEGEAYNVENPADFQISSGLLPEAGRTPITLTVTDSRGLTLTSVQYIDVLAYAPPAIISFDVWRVNRNGVADEQGEYVQYSFTTTHTDFGGINQLSAALTVDGKTEQNVRNTGWLLPSTRLTFTGANVYPVELTLKDTYESITLGAAVIRPLTGTTVVIRPTRRGKRGLVIGDYDTTQEADWTLAALSFPEPDYEQKFVAVPGRKAGPLDMSAVLTDGVPTYGSRSLAARLELSEGTRDERNVILSKMINQLDGRRWEITLPDDPDRYVVGRVSVKIDYSDLAHASVSVSAICEPWRYNKLVTEIAYAATVTAKEGVLPNIGRMPVVPNVTVTDGVVQLQAAGHSWTLSEGEYTLPGLVLHPGNTPITYSGYGVISFAYREAVL